MARIVALADLFFGAKIKETLTAAGHEVSLAAAPQDVSSQDKPPDIVIVDLDSSRHDAPRFGNSTRLLGFYSHVDVEVRRRAEEAGFDLVVPRSRMAREMPELVKRLVGSDG